MPGVFYINRQRHIPIGWLLTSIDPSDWVANQFYCSSLLRPCAFVQLLFCDVDLGCDYHASV